MNSHERVVSHLSDVVRSSRNGLPSLAHAIQAISTAQPTPKLEADVRLLADSVLTMLGQVHIILIIVADTQEWETASDETLLCDVPGIRSLDGKPPRENLERLILRGLEPRMSIVGAVIALFKGGAKLPFIPNLKALSAEVVDGWPLGEVRRRRGERFLDLQA